MDHPVQINYLGHIGRGDGQAVPGALLVGSCQGHELGHARHGVRDLLVDVHGYQAAGIVADEEAEDGALGLSRGSHGHPDLGELHLQLGQPVTVPHYDLVADILRDHVGIHGDGGDKVEEDVVALGLLGHGVSVRHLQLIEGLEQEPLALVLEVLEGGLGGDEVGVADDGPDKEPVVADLSASIHFRPPEVEVHLVVGDGDGVQVIVLQPVELQLKGEGGLQVPEDHVLLVVVLRPEREVLGKLLWPEDHEGDSPDELLLEEVNVLPAEGVEHGANVGVVDRVGDLDGNVDDVGGLPALIVLRALQPQIGHVPVVVRVGAADVSERKDGLIPVPEGAYFCLSPLLKELSVAHNYEKGPKTITGCKQV